MGSVFAQYVSNCLLKQHDKPTVLYVRPVLSVFLQPPSVQRSPHAALNE